MWEWRPLWQQPNCPAKGKSCRRRGGANHFAKKSRSKKKEGQREEQKFSRREDPARETEERDTKVGGESITLNQMNLTVMTKGPPTFS
ncbi:hypothetical protein ACOMHN_014764 [Nucella lapillus]